jgi:predicted GIY-YIG superfamily endonuclease
MSFWTYLLRCNDGSLYVGHTDNIERRIGEHQQGLILGYTARRRPVTLLWSQDFPTREEALTAELQIKRWSRAKKEALTRGEWTALQSLAKKRFG